ncbi:MAG: DUF1553 domain-containing protein [Planctomycetota bacterium]|nr:MAG: DUF1553 domain-containing protein [Planctomycetota bacterium]
MDAIQVEMHAPHRFSLATTGGGLLVCLLSILPSGHCDDRGAIEFFERQVVPILQEHCLECHSHAAGEASGGLMLDALPSMLQGGTRGPAIVAGDPAHSLLLQAVEYADDELQMPPEGKLDPAQRTVLEQWIRDGAHVPEAWKRPARGGKPEGMPGGPQDPANHWAYRPPQDNTAEVYQRLQTILPAEQCQQLRTGIDVLVADALQAKGLFFAPPADAATLIRRVSYDLRGLPPTAEEVRPGGDPAASVGEAIDRWVDACLADPAFGERWARHWMDVARYADNKGYVFREDREYPEAYRYRDWLIQALNNDMPFDRFVTYQLAADLIDGGNPAHLPALGFLTLGRRFLNNQFDIIDDRLDVVTRGLMGMTLTCARCHDHKYDPITQADYYALAGVFLNCQEPGGEPFLHRLVDAEKIRPAFVLLRGNPRSIGPQVPRRFVHFLDPEAEPFPLDRSGRLELAAHIVAPDNPLTARVIVNRVWMHLMGSPLVDTPSDFGMRCPQPELLPVLDHLAIYLVEHDWSVKQLVRYILASRCYRQSSMDRSPAGAVDPENLLYHRMNRKRLDLEALRDTLLVRAGRLDRTMGGPSVRIDVPPETGRRTVYAYIDRQNLPSMFRTFDMAGPDTHSPRRPQTSVPQQGLFVLNSPFVNDLAAQLGREFASQAQREGTLPAAARMFEHVLGRPAEREELQWIVEFVQNSAVADRRPAQQRWECGFGAYDPQAGTLSGFTPLPAFIDGGWRGGSTMPDPQLGWCLLTPTGGHVGNDLAHAVVRRWHAPRDGRATVEGELAHGQPQGDGVRGTVLVDGRPVGSWSVHNGKTRTAVAAVDLSRGSIVDFVTDCVGSVSHDSFQWMVKIRYTDGQREVADSKRDFPQPIPEPLGPWGQLAQVLLATNELAFVD